MGDRFSAADYGITWPTEPAEIVQEALCEYVGDGDGADEAVLAAYDAHVAAQALREAADELVAEFGVTNRAAGRLRARADRLDPQHPESGPPRPLSRPERPNPYPKDPPTLTNA